jgi:hypothetical protein
VEDFADFFGGLALDANNANLPAGLVFHDLPLRRVRPWFSAILRMVRTLIRRLVMYFIIINSFLGGLLFFFIITDIS